MAEDEEEDVLLEETENNGSNKSPTAPQRHSATPQHNSNGNKKRRREGEESSSWAEEVIDKEVIAASKENNGEAIPGQERMGTDEQDDTPVVKKVRLSTGSTNTYREMFGTDDEDQNDTPAGKNSRLSSGSTNTFLEMFGTDDDDDDDGIAAKTPPPKPRQLSKFASRLLDPNRQRGLVEPPQTIPLNDEFLQAFGRRERQHDEKIGRQLVVDTSNLDDKEDDGANSSEEEEEEKHAGKRAKVGVKVKLSNLNYATTKLTITRRCEEFGALLSVNLILDPKTSKSMGRAYVVFDSEEDAQKCVAAMNDKPLEGRAVRMTICSNGNSSASEKSTRRGTESAGLANLFRYWERDLSTKCRRCGQVGHVAAQCLSEDNAQGPCPLCGAVDHESSALRQCPYSTFCFNCGAPGHVNRECPHRRSLPRRIVCGYCCRSGHHRWSCPEISTGWGRRNDVLENASQNAKCFVCGQVGHFMCGTGMKWFFDLPGQVYCFNCGMEGHHGSRCERPNLEACSHDFEVVQKEIDRAEAACLEMDLRAQRNKSRGGNDRVGRSSSYSERAHGNRSNNYDDDRESRGRQRSDGRSNARDDYIRTSSLPPPAQGSRHGMYSRQSSREYYNNDAQHYDAPLQRGRSRSDNSASSRSVSNGSRGGNRSQRQSQQQSRGQRGYR